MFVVTWGGVDYIKDSALLHTGIMCGYQCDKALTNNDTRFELSNQIDCNNLVGPIGLHVIF